VRLLIYTPAFLPLVGGLEINQATLAAEFQRAGHEVVVVTRTPDGGAGDDLPFRVVRRPGPAELLRWTRWCDVFVQANVSLRGIWPLVLVRRPWVVSHHSWYCRTDGRIAWQDRLKRRLLRRAAASIAVSRAVARDLTTPSTVIENGYRERLFRVIPGVERTVDLVFLGRLVSDKGVDVLLDALALLEREGLAPRLTVVGDGPEAPRLAEQARRLGLGERVHFAGTRTGEDLVELLNRHRVLVVPSRYAEPFGTVALEGIACGCAVVGSERGGLPEAIGPCGRTFRNGDAADLARVLGELLGDPEVQEACRRRAPEHLARHASAAVAAAYLDVLAAVAPRRAAPAAGSDGSDGSDGAGGAA
jgi:glycosyltransferase involved in cell wall biosynthesis